MENEPKGSDSIAPVSRGERSDTDEENQRIWAERWPKASAEARRVLGILKDAPEGKD